MGKSDKAREPQGGGPARNLVIDTTMNVATCMTAVDEIADSRSGAVVSVLVRSTLILN
jgi:hypothetical protein